MRLVVLFDANFVTKSTDIVISQEEFFGECKCAFRVNFYDEINYSEQLENFVENLKIKQNQKQIFESSINNFNRNFITPLLKWISTVNHAIKEYKISEVVISGYTNQSFFVPYYEAEGETGKKLLYKSSDVIPYYIKKHLEKILPIQIVNKKSKIRLIFRVFARRYFLLLVKFFIYFFNALKSSKSKNTKEKIILSSRGIAHTEYFYEFLKSKEQEVTFHYTDSLYGINKNEEFIKKQNYNNIVSNNQSIRVLDTVKLLFQTIKNTFLVRKVKDLTIENISININSAYKEMSISYYDALIYKKGIERQIGLKTKAIITGEMYTPYAYVIKLLGKAYNLKTYQLQTTSMVLKKEPSFFYCDKFIFNSLTNANSFKKLYPDEESKIKFFGNLIVNETKTTQNKRKTELKKIVFFTQPNYEQEDEDLIVNKLLEIKEKYNLLLDVKLHPRDNINKFKNKQLGYVNTDLIFKQYINNYDLAIIRNTSLGSSIIIEGIPLISCLLSKTTQAHSLDYIEKSYFGTVYNIENLEDKIINFDKLVDSFQELRIDYINKNNLIKGVNNFINHIEEDIKS